MKNLSVIVFLVLGICFSSCRTTSIANNRIPPPPPPPKPSSIYQKYIPADEEIINGDWINVTTQLSNGNFRHRVFYPEKFQCTKEITATDEYFNNKEGSYKEWWDDGYKKTEGQHENDEKVGLWKEYSFDDGTLVNETIYEKGKIQGIQKNYKNEILSSSYTFKMGVKEGSFIVYDSLGAIYNEGIFKADTIFSMTLKQTDQPIDVVQTMPLYPGCDDEVDQDKKRKCAQTTMLKYIYSYLRYPDDARRKDIEGMALIQFTIDIDGSLIDIKTRRGVCKSIEEESLRVVKSMPNWTPGYQDGKPVRVQFNLPIRYKLQ